ncbi:MAG TPA: type II secretion system protein [Dongiaceae bacterium]|nr:type II secretion system protein [Dongiaceae bacterium]
MNRKPEAGYSMVELLVVLVFISIIAGIAINGGYYAFDASRTSRTVAQLRGVADAITKYQSDNSTIPGGGLQPVSAIAATIAPTQSNFPTRDGWDNPIYYEPFVTAGGSLTFRLYSYGKDGASDGVITGTWVDFYSDIVVEGSSFVQTRW